MRAGMPNAARIICNMLNINIVQIQ
jgi:hypothetical protein